MKNRPLGCMTFSALVAAIISLLVVAGFIVATGNSIFSPGDLNAVAQTDGAQAISLGGVSTHAQLEGKCDACHASIWSGKKMGDMCMTCHSDVADQSRNSTGLHGKLDANASTCLRCHTEHHGATAPATLADPHVFPHDETGYALTAHTQPVLRDAITCRQCHPASPRDYAQQDCQTCHAQRDAAKMAVHTDTYGTTCLNCHDGKDSYGHAFTHTAYALEGKHGDTACAGCHKGSTTLAALRSTSTACVSCHGAKDIHAGRLGSDCASCHTPKGWDGATLDHTNQTKFALTGKHATAACETCHVNRKWTGLDTACASCHAKDDAHKGKFGSDCAKCHNANGWDDTANFDHSVTGFALTASHRDVSCEKCHADKHFANTPTNCAGCHASDDQHKGALGTSCESCHKPTRWSDASFNHSTTSFKLVGKHSGVACEQCHTKAPPSATSTTCVSCHASQDKHNGSFGTVCETCHNPSSWSDAHIDHSKFAFKLTGAHAGVTCSKCHTGGNPKNTPTACASCHNKPASHDTYFGGACSSCHSTKAWRPAAFDHAKTTYKLTGAHLSVTCLKCHKQPAVTFKGAPSICESCHDKPANHTGPMGTNCSQCHTTKAWRPSTFSHGSTGFPLVGAHTSLLCTKCHTGSTFGGLSATCASCHNKPASHPSFYGTTCTKCHTQSAWTPIHYTASHTFPIYHRNAGGVCTKCHTSSFSAYTCAKCHDPNNIEGHAGRSSSSCASCHPTGGGGG